MRFLSSLAGVCLTVALHAMLLSPIAFGQNGGNPGGGNQGGGNQNGGNGGQFPGGILINPSGVVDRSVVLPSGGAALQKKLRQAAAQNLSTELNQKSERRHVSLKRLEEEITKQLKGETLLSPDVRFLAGLTRIDFVFVIDDGQDIVIAGPAEGFAPITNGRVIGVESGRSALNLDDLLVSLRSAAAESAVGCSIDPDPQRLRDSQQWLKQNSSPATLDVARARLERMVALQGNWNITTFGVPEGSRMCLSMIEADYLMKRLAIGVDNPGVRGMKSSLALAGPGDNMMRRWWFAPHYEPVERNPQRTAFRLAGPRFQLFAQEEVMDANGNLTDADFTQKSSEKFARLFNERIDELVQRYPSFADLQNIFDILTAMAIVRDCQSRGVLNWKPAVLLDEDALPVSNYLVAKETTPMLNVKMSGGSLVIGAFSGGVTFKPARVVRQFQESSSEELSHEQKSMTPTLESSGRWWWD